MTESGESPPVAAENINPSVPPALPPREHLISTAMKFLANPNVMRSAITQKQSFLRSKGLTEDEIQLACERAGVFTNDPTVQKQHTVISMSAGPAGYAKTNSYVIQPPSQSSWFVKLKEVLSSVALVSGVMYGVYLFYKVARKHYIERKLLNARMGAR